ncbi:putative ribonuclease H-like domain-containing protein, partial [Tanacetum coccineum]
ERVLVIDMLLKERRGDAEAAANISLDELTSLSMRMTSWKKKKALFFKVDFTKAYDSVRWDFLLDVLEAFGFGSTWCTWIRDGQGAWDAELDLSYSDSYITEEMLGKLGFVRLDYGEYGKRMVKEVRVEIHGFNFLVDFVVIAYANEGDPSIMFGKDFLFSVMGEVGSASNELAKMGKANRNNNYNVNKLKPPTSPKIEEIPPISSSAPQPVYHPLSPKQKEKILGALDRKYKELEEQMPIVEVLENYMVYRKKLDEVMMGRARLENKNFGDEEKDRLIENGLPKKMYDPGNFVLSVQVNKTTQLSALADMGANMSVLPYTLFKNLGLSDPRSYQSNLTMADNTQAKAIGEVINVRIQIGYQAYLADFLVLDIPVDKELPLLLGRLFLCTCGEIINMGHGTMTIDDGVIRHTYFPKPRAKAYLENLEIDEDKDWLGCFEVGRDEDGNL